MHLGQLIGPELDSLLADDPAHAKELLREVHPEDLAEAFEDFNDERAVALLTQLPTDYAAQVFARLDQERQEQLAQKMGVESAAELAIGMDADERADFFSVIPTELSETLLEEIEHQDPEVAEDVEELTRWPETSAGGLMTTDYLAIGAQLTMTEAIEAIRQSAAQVETVDVAFVVEGDERLVGVLSLRQILISSPTALVADMMTRSVISVPPELDQEEVANKLAKYDLAAIPVVDASGRMLGVITADDVLDVLKVEQAEDVQKMGAVEPIRDSYFDTSFFLFLRKRGVWLIALFIGGFGTTQVLHAYRTTLDSLVELSFYLPLLISAGGNSGAQSSTLLIRSLAVGDVTAQDWFRVFVRELLQGVALGALLAPFGVIRVLVMGDGFPLALLIGVTIIAIVATGCLIGAMTPLLLHRLGLDPATSSTPLIATVVDVLGIVFYLAAAKLLLGNVLPASSH